MTRTACDVCGNLIDKKYLDRDDDLAIDLSLNDKKFQLTGPFARNGEPGFNLDVCPYCLIDAFAKLDDRPKAVTA